MDLDIVRAWKNASLSEEQRTLFPHNPSGELEITDEVLSLISGGKNQSEDKYPTSFAWFCMTRIDPSHY